MAHQTMVRNVPQEFDRLIAAPPHRLFAVFDRPAAGEEAVAALRARGVSGEDDIWVLFGEEGRRRLDLSGSGHGLHGELVRLLQRIMSADVEYLRGLDEALGMGAMVVAVTVAAADLDWMVALLRGQGGHSLGRVAHWDYVPVPG